GVPAFFRARTRVDDRAGGACTATAGAETTAPAGASAATAATDSAASPGVPKLKVSPTCSVTGTTNRWLPLDWTVRRAVNVSPGLLGTDGTARWMVALRPLSLARLTSSQ